MADHRIAQQPVQRPEYAAHQNIAFAARGDFMQDQRGNAVRGGKNGKIGHKKSPLSCIVAARPPRRKGKKGLF